MVLWEALWDIFLLWVDCGRQTLLLISFEPAIIFVSFPIWRDFEKMSSGKQLVKGKSGLRMIAVSEDERCPFLLEEPHWTDDTQV